MFTSRIKLRTLVMMVMTGIVVSVGTSVAPADTAAAQRVVVSNGHGAAVVRPVNAPNVAVMTTGSYGVRGDAVVVNPYSGNAVYVAPQWGRVPVAYQNYYGPTYVYANDWYVARHLTYPQYYSTYSYDPGGVCVTEYYFYQGVYYCYHD